MAIELSLVQQRGTIFVPKFIGYSEDNAANYHGLLDGAKPIPVPVPSPFGVPMQPEALQSGGNWQLVRGVTRIVFLPNRIDIIKDWISPRNEKEEKEFLELCSRVFGEILSHEGLTASRVAYAPAFARDKDSTFNDGLVWDCLLTKPNFDSLTPLEVSVVRNFRSKKIIAGKEYDINFRSSFASANHTLMDGTVATGSVLVNFDINSIPEKDYAFTLDTLKCFFDTALEYSNSMYNYFLGE